MRYRLLDILCCPFCNNCFELRSFKSDLTKYDVSAHSKVSSKEWERLYQEDIKEGILICSNCNQVYPIVNYIPRILPNILSDYPEFYLKYTEEIDNNNDQSGDYYLEKGLKKTKEGFGYEWLKFDVSSRLENTLTFFLLTGIDPAVYNIDYEYLLSSKSWVGDLNKTINDIDYNPNGEFLKDKLILDAGCGMGRFVEVANKFDGEVVGVDISKAVDRARKRTQDNPFTHLIQSDLSNLPFNKSSFDYIYCIFVIQHTPNPPKVFRHLLNYLKEDCQISLTAYEKSNYKIKDQLETSIRIVSTKLPIRIVSLLSYIGIPLGWLQGKIYNNSILRLLGAPFLLVVVGMHPNWRIRLTDTFDRYIAEYQYRYTRIEFKELFFNDDLIDIEFIPWNPCPAGLVMKGKKRNSLKQ